MFFKYENVSGYFCFDEMTPHGWHPADDSATVWSEASRKLGKVWMD